MNPYLDLGPVGSLLGTWKGLGKDVAFRPDGSSRISEYIEEMVVSAVPVMQIGRTTFVHAATYTTRLIDPKTFEPLHHETGYWAWVPETGTALRIIALGRALGVVAKSGFVPAPDAIRFQFQADATSAPAGIATADLGPGIPAMEQFSCAVEVVGNALTYDQVTRVRFGAGPLVDHTDAAKLIRQP